MIRNTKPTLVCEFTLLPAGAHPEAIRTGEGRREFHVSATARSRVGLRSTLFQSSGNLILPDFSAARNFAAKLRSIGNLEGQDLSGVSAGRLNALGLVDEVLHAVFAAYRRERAPAALENLAAAAEAELGPRAYADLLLDFTRRFPPRDVYAGLASAEDWLEGRSAAEVGSGSAVGSSSAVGSDVASGTTEAGGSAAAGSTAKTVPNRLIALEELILLKISNENPATGNHRVLFDDGVRPGKAKVGSLAAGSPYLEAFAAFERAAKALPAFGPQAGEEDILSLLRSPAREAPESIEAQLRWMRSRWGARFRISEDRLLGGLDLISEEETPRFPPGPGPVVAYTYRLSRQEYEKFSTDRDWMPDLVLMAKNALVWLHQLSVAHSRPITRLDQIPDSDLDQIAARGINGLWLIGIWERSPASEAIKRRCGNPEAAASAYSLFDYDIAAELGGWDALDRLRERCQWRGIRLAADMVPNHTGIDSRWVRERPDLFLGTDECPFPSYTFEGPDLSGDPAIGIWLEDHYYSRSDAAVVFKRLDRRTGRVRYIYHGNDGTGMAWNDTAQIDFLNPEAREAVKERILHVARHFSIIRFDAAMVLARQHVRRLWYPAPGAGGAIPSRSGHAMGDEAFDRAMPSEFWREVVDLCAKEAADTLLLAEAFWMMEGYFVRTLGMHRVYNSAFMNMLKDEKNSLYRLTMKNTQEFDPQILKRFVNFMSNPDEETAVAQFGSGDKYFGVCTLLATMPGLPMFGHGQIEGLTEKYGMEYRRSYREEAPDLGLVARHEREIFPLLRMRFLFAQVERFNLFDFIIEHGQVDENVFAYSNGSGGDRALIFFNNAWRRTRGRIVSSTPIMEKDESGSKRLHSRSLAEALGFGTGPDIFVVAREFRSGLWRLFSARTLASEGLSISLEGYEVKVFLEISSVHDEDGRYARLHRSLGEAGVPDLDEALEESARPELFHALAEALKAIKEGAPLFSAVAGGAAHNADAYGADAKAAGVQAAGVQAAARRIREKAELYYSRLAQEIDAEGGSRPGIEAVSKACAHLERGLSILLDSNSKLGSGDGDTLPILVFIFMDALARLDLGANRSEELRYLLEKFHVASKLKSAFGESITELAYAFTTRPRAIPPAPAELMAGVGSASGATAAAGAKARAAAGAGAVAGSVAGAAAGTTSSPRDADSRAATRRALEIFRWAQGDRLARRALGVNLWEGEEYFIAEKLEALLRLWPKFAMLEAAGPEPASPAFALSTAGTASATPAGMRPVSEDTLLTAEKAHEDALLVAAAARKASEGCRYQLPRLVEALERSLKADSEKSVDA